MFEGLEHEKTPEERKGLFLEITLALIACLVIGAAAFWFFNHFAEY
jgi:hypothetical protein